MRGKLLFRVALFSAGPLAAALAMAGCGGGGSASANSSNPNLSVAPGTGSIDTNCTGCNATNSSGAPVEQFSATLSNGNTASVTWAVSGGDASTGAGTISSSGQYSPPSYLTADGVQVTVTATLASSSTTASAMLTVTPGFLQPLTPENVALGAGATVTVKGYIAEAGGSTGINFAVSNSATGSSGGEGALSAPSCQRGAQSFTHCSVTYTAPPAVSSTGATYIVATVGTSASKTSAEVLVNTADIASNPATHEGQLPLAVDLGSSGGNNNDYDTSGNQIVDCCSGTLGSLLEGSDGVQYLLSNNHVLARSDHASVGDRIIQPGLIDANCTPNGEPGSQTTVVGSLTGWLSLKSAETNADAAIAQVAAGAVSPTGDILELGPRQPDGTLAAAAPGVSSSGGKGETASLQMKVAKSGRTTGLTCAAISALDLDVSVDYFSDCAETKPYLTKTYTNQLAISGNEFSDAGDSGSLVVDTGDAEPVGLFFAGGTDASGVGEGVASPAPDVLNELSAQVGSGTTYAFVGTADHAVSCLNYGDGTVNAAQARELSDEQISRGLQAAAQARALVNPSAGILGVAAGKSNDRPGEAAVIVYVAENSSAAVPAEAGGVRTMVIAASAQAVASGTAPLTNYAQGNAPLPAAELARAMAIKQQAAGALMRQNPAFFGVGVGQSLDNPREAALVIYVDRKHVPANLPQSVDGLRTRYIVMNRFHVTRSYAVPTQSRCSPGGRAEKPVDFDPLLRKPLDPPLD